MVFWDIFLDAAMVNLVYLIIRPVIHAHDRHSSAGQSVHPFTFFE